MSRSWTAQAIASEWLGRGRRVIAATLVDKIGSAPLDPGAEMLVDETGRIEGTVTGGCVEAALFEEAQRVLAGEDPRSVQYGVSDAEAADVGLMCGGTVHVFVHEIAHHRDAISRVAEAVGEGRPAALATLLEGDGAGRKMAVLEDRVVGSLGVTELLDRSVERDARGFLEEGLSQVRRYGPGGEVMGSEIPVYIQAFASPPEMVIFGAIDFSAVMARMASEMGFRVMICDARGAFARSPRFSEAAEVAIDWPDRYMAGRELGPRDVILVFTHDPKFDEPALTSALESGAGYVGALGSRRTHEKRVERLRNAGLSEEAIARIHAPCGLDIGARTPAETVTSILAEVIATRTSRSGHSLRDTSGPIHPREQANSEVRSGARDPGPHGW